MRKPLQAARKPLQAVCNSLQASAESRKACRESLQAFQEPLQASSALRKASTQGPAIVHNTQPRCLRAAGLRLGRGSAPSLSFARIDCMSNRPLRIDCMSNRPLRWRFDRRNGRLDIQSSDNGRLDIQSSRLRTAKSPARRRFAPQPRDRCSSSLPKPLATCGNALRQRNRSFVIRAPEVCAWGERPQHAFPCLNRPRTAETRCVSQAPTRAASTARRGAGAA